MSSDTGATGLLTNKLSNLKHSSILLPFYFQILDLVENHTTLSKEDFHGLVDGKSIEERQKQLKKSRKRERKSRDKFVPEEIQKPKTVMHLFRQEYRQQCKDNNTSFENNKFLEAWANIPSSERKRLEKQHQLEVEAYNKEFERQKKNAIQSGDFLPDEPKKGKNAYMIFKEYCRQNMPKYFNKKELKEIKSIKNPQLMKLFGKKWNEIKDTNNEERIKFELLSKKDKHRYLVEKHNRSEFIIKRQIEKALREGDTEKVNVLNEKLQELQDEAPGTFNEENALKLINNIISKEQTESQTHNKSNSDDSDEEEEKPKQKAKTTKSKATRGRKKKEPEPEPEPESESEKEVDNDSDSDYTEVESD